MDQSEFMESSPGHLVSTTNGAMAFVPDALPKSIDLTPRAIRSLAEAENALGRLAGKATQMLNPYLVGSPMLYREAILSSRMEGTVTTPEKLVLLDAESSRIPAGRSPDSETREVQNYMKAMNFGLQRLNELPVCLRLLREIHGELMKGARGGRERPGEFRDKQNWIGSSTVSIQDARLVPPPVAEMGECLQDFEAYLNEDWDDPHGLPLLVRLGLVHYQFETIHPFRDGNGRIGRLLIPLLLCSADRMRYPLLYVSAYLERRRDDYTDLLLEVSRRGDWIAWVEFFLATIGESAEESIRQAGGLIELRERYQQDFQKARKSGLLQKLIDRLFMQPSITIRQAADATGLTDAAAAHNVRKLEDAGILYRVEGRSHPRVYVADEILRFLYDAEEGDEEEV